MRLRTYMIHAHVLRLGVHLSVASFSCEKRRVNQVRRRRAGTGGIRRLRCRRAVRWRCGSGRWLLLRAALSSRSVRPWRRLRAVGALRQLQEAAFRAALPRLRVLVARLVQVRLARLHHLVFRFRLSLRQRQRRLAHAQRTASAACGACLCAREAAPQNALVLLRIDEDGRVVCCVRRRGRQRDARRQRSGLRRGESALRQRLAAHTRFATERKQMAQTTAKRVNGRADAPSALGTPPARHTARTGRPRFPAAARAPRARRRLRAPERRVAARWRVSSALGAARAARSACTHCLHLRLVVVAAGLVRHRLFCESASAKLSAAQASTGAQRGQASGTARATARQLRRACAQRRTDCVGRCGCRVVRGLALGLHAALPAAARRLGKPV
jgi:hypothetical protein